MLRSTTSGVTRHRLRLIATAALGLALIAEFVTASALLNRPATTQATAAGTHTMRLLDRGAPAALERRIAAELPGAVAAVTAFWGDDWPREIMVVTTGNDADFAVETGQPSRDWTGVAAVSVADHVDVDRREASGQRIVFAPGANAMSQSAFRIVLRHELFHYAARSRTALDAPSWLVEGVADYVGRPPAPRPGPTAVPATLPTDADLAAGGKKGSAAYDRAWWFARFVADEYGPSGLRRLYIEACGPSHPDPDQAARTALGVGLGDLLSRWQRWIAG
jgi:hypothetical protein